MMARILVAAAALGLGLAHAAIAEDGFGPGNWKNELGSVMTVTGIDPQTGAIAGVYVTAVASPGCDAVGKRQPLNGFYNAASGSVTFAVNWLAQGCASVTSWSGNFDKAANNLPTIWILSANPGWASKSIGTNTFTRQP